MTGALQYLLSGEHLCDIKEIKDGEMEGFKNQIVEIITNLGHLYQFPFFATEGGHVKADVNQS